MLAEPDHKATEGAMNLKTFSGESMGEALSQVKKDLGKDAVILHTRTYRVGGVLGVGGRQMVEITASDQLTSRGPTIRDRVPPREAGSAALRSSLPSQTSLPRDAALQPESDDRFQPATFSRASTVVGGPIDPARLTAQNAGGGATQFTSASRAASKTSGLAVKVEMAPASDAAALSLREELDSIKRLVGQVLEVARRPAAHGSDDVSRAGFAAAPIVASGGLSDPLFALDQRLLDEGIDTACREAVIGALRTSLAASIAQPGSPALATAAVGALARMIPCDTAPSDTAPRNPSSGAQASPRVVALIGPTGVGKTTTIAKLAAFSRLRRGQRVALITADTYRIAAVEQLRTYAEILDIPFKVALTPTDMASAIASCADADLILIDTAGRSPTDAARLDELNAFLSVARPDKTHLVLAATSSAPVLRRIVERFAALSPNTCIISKLDESPTIGQAIAAARGAALPISFVTMGQEVPEHLEVARPETLARRMLGLDS
jgi:flagellar biosynthesis protein FlhF